MDRVGISSSVLVVEDEPLIRWHAAEFLDDAGFNVIEAENAVSALQFLENRTDIGLIFTEINLPGSLTGIGLAKRAHEHWPHIRLLITSSAPVLARDLPKDDLFVPKPYLDQEVIRMVRAMLIDQKL